MFTETSRGKQQNSQQEKKLLPLGPKTKHMQLHNVFSLMTG